MKTYKQWVESNVDSFYDFISPGEALDERIVDEFFDHVPPAFHTRDIVQVGEPSGYVLDAKTGDDRYTFTTFQRRGGQWFYCGECFFRETTEPNATEGQAI